MKATFLFTLICSAQLAWAQSEAIEYDIVEFVMPVAHEHTDFNRSPLTDSILGKYTVWEQRLLVNYLETGIRFKVIQKTKNHYVIEALPFSQKKGGTSIQILDKSYVESLDNKGSKQDSIYRVWLKNPENKKRINELVYNSVQYSVTVEDFEAKARPIKKRPDKFSIGLLTLPFKYRPQAGGSFDSDFNLSPTLNISLFPTYNKQVYFYAQIGAGIGNVNLTHDIAPGLELGESQKVSTVTAHLGIMAQYKNVQFGIYSGIDWINNQARTQWINQGNAWFGLGLGYQVFNFGTTNQPKKN